MIESGHCDHLEYRVFATHQEMGRAAAADIEREIADRLTKQEQVNDGCFPTIEDVPTTALTLTIPALLGANRLFCIVPGPTKADAVRRTLQGQIPPSCPATVLRTHPHCTLYLDTDSFAP
jgi:glucosamine-6-phosphate deaminase